jgi:isopentenyl diphosphate isomerase/L-lactate dehydrogenase-like FMN-dependent dehydrogenase
MHEKRKSDHIRINLEEDVNFRSLTTGLEKYHFLHQALPEIDLAEVNTSVTFLEKQLKAPLLISSMTGGTEERSVIRRNLPGTVRRTDDSTAGKPGSNPAKLRVYDRPLSTGGRYA